MNKQLYDLPSDKDRWLDISFFGGLQEVFKDKYDIFDNLYTGNLYRMHAYIKTDDGSISGGTFYFDNQTLQVIMNVTRLQTFPNGLEITLIPGQYIKLIYMYGLGGVARYNPNYGLFYEDIEQVKEQYLD
jgi:hypothetical protein